MARGAGGRRGGEGRNCRLGVVLGRVLRCEDRSWPPPVAHDGAMKLMELRTAERTLTRA